MQDRPAAGKSSTAKSATGREFDVQSIFFENGTFLIISEGPFRIGAISASIASTGGKVSTAKVIASKYDSMFITTISEKVSSLINGICLVSLHSKTPLQLDDMKAIMEVIMDTIAKRTANDGEKRSTGS